MVLTSGNIAGFRRSLPRDETSRVHWLPGRILLPAPTMLVRALRSLFVLLSAASATCEDFATYSTRREGTPSTGPLGLQFMRPDVGCRAFNSSVVEKVVANLTGRMKDPDLARLFENTYTNTLDTTVKWFNDNLTFVVTGDIPAEWLRDSVNQFKVYLPLVGHDEPLKQLTRGVINQQARYITQFPC
ncbi:Six-hairpin glycosidase-like protein [Mycena rebaudengoi]|nr:Six-hairpin glycosidase-like protein [Mycena rebaudengoi]